MRWVASRLGVALGRGVRVGVEVSVGTAVFVAVGWGVFVSVEVGAGGGANVVQDESTRTEINKVTVKRCITFLLFMCPPWGAV